VSANLLYTVTPIVYTLSDFLTEFDYFVPRTDRTPKEQSWTSSQLLSWQKSYLMSVFCQQYVHRLVLREKRDDIGIVMEVLDGWLRIGAIKNFLQNRIPLPVEIRYVFPDAFGANIEGNATYRGNLDRSPYFSTFVKDERIIYADIIKGIDNPRVPHHEDKATELFASLQAHR